TSPRRKGETPLPNVDSATQPSAAMTTAASSALKKLIVLNPGRRKPTNISTRADTMKRTIVPSQSNPITSRLPVSSPPVVWRAGEIPLPAPGGQMWAAGSPFGMEQEAHEKSEDNGGGHGRARLREDAVEEPEKAHLLQVHDGAPGKDEAEVGDGDGRSRAADADERLVEAQRGEDGSQHDEDHHHVAHGKPRPVVEGLSQRAQGAADEKCQKVIHRLFPPV